MLAHWLPLDPGRGLQRYPRLREMLDELYENGLLPPSDIYVGDTDVVVELAAAGAIPDDFQVALTNNTITISGQVPAESGLGEAQLQGIRRGRFEQSLNLPVPVEPATAEATYSDGILRVRMARVEATRPQLVPVRRETEDGSASPRTLERKQVAARH
ncbi:MAG TPA: Hsp20/alpha crystallin family protein [Chloroflexota bacterium]|nr:Hsp20/alpha crystallin family protein [Chloroflexota bacterium]